jgi:hypothetical protein
MGSTSVAVVSGSPAEGSPLILDRAWPWRLLLVVVAAGVLVMLFGAGRAEATPIVTFKCSPAPQNCSGWYRSNVSIDWEVSPSDAAVLGGCQDKTFTADTPAAGTNELCKVDDGEATVTVELKIKLDKTAPVVLGGQPGRGADLNGWYNHPVAIAFSGSDLTSGIAACTAPTYSGPDSGAAALSGTCVDNAGNVSTPFPYGLKYDATTPAGVSGQLGRGADVNGWYNRPVSVAFSGTDPTSGVDSCAATTYEGPDSNSASVPGTCRDRAGNVSSPIGVGFRYDSTAPAVTGVLAARGPDQNGWYNHPVDIAFRGSDPTSAVEGCTRTTYGGPDSATVSLSGTCTDRAGNVSSPLPFGLKYDGTAPLITELRAAPQDGRVAVRWRTTAEVESVTVVRAPGAGSKRTSVVYRGGGKSFYDRTVVNRVRYVYEVRASDAAGNSTSRAVAAVPGPRLLSPARNAVVGMADLPTLQWTTVRRARYYNVQLFRDGRKIMSAWPSKTEFRLKRHWSYRGRKRGLVPGRYRWLVWPGYGRRANNDYGEMLGPTFFRVSR